jgi:signal transduction histidine kinase/ActR/RegA family two-component response regulator
VQHFINRATSEKTAAEIFNGPRARHYLIGFVALVTAACVGLALATIWLGVALLVEKSCLALRARLSTLTRREARAAHLGLDVASTSILAAAPAMAWYSRADLGPALAVTLLLMLSINAAFNGRRGRLNTVAACAPYGVLALLFLLEGSAANAAVATFACLLVVGYAFAAALQHAHRAAHERMQDGEWVRQLNMSFGDEQSAAWELDFARNRLAGGQQLAAVLGRPISFEDIIENDCFAAPADRAMVRAAFSPENTGVRRIALQHDVISAGGATVRIHHQGFMRAAPDGAPMRLTCITQIVPEAAQTSAHNTADAITAALVAQTEALRTLSNELSSDLNLDVAAQDLSQMLRLLVERASAIEAGVDDLAHARHAAESANLAKSQFLANMSHELRTPLNAVIGYAEMLQEDAADEDNATAVQDLNRILAAAKHLLSLINEILDLSKIEAGRVDVAPTNFDPAGMLDDLIETVRPMAEQNGNAIRVVGVSPPGNAQTDALKIRQCVLNLLSNACKFTRNGNVEIALDRKPYNGVEQLFITVRDTGIGMSNEHLSRLFQPFVQADPSITQQYGGTGLGLTITRRLAQLLGGDVTVRSKLGEGSSFTLHVPANFADAASALGAAAAVDAVQGSEDAPLVIVIEDEPDARELAARALTRAGFAVQGVGGGEAGLALARTKAPALVLLDIFLPDRSGWRVLQSLKHDPKTQDIPVVVLSVNEDRAHAMALGAAEHMVKPADRDVLAATVMRYARKRPQPAAAGAVVTQLTQKHAG